MSEPEKQETTTSEKVARRTVMEKLAERMQLIVYMVLVVAALVVLNVIVARKYSTTSWDVTKNKRYSLSPESVKVVEGVTQTLELDHFDRSENFPRARDLLAKYERSSNHVKVAYYDPDRRPDQARLYGIQSYGTTVVKAGTRKELVSTLSEEDVTNAIVRVLKGNKTAVYFALGDGERDPNDSGRAGYSDVKRALEAENFTINTVILAQTPKVPADCGVLVVAGPTHELPAPETQAIADYLDHGGHVLFMVGPAGTGSLVDYLQNTLNVKMSRNVVVDMSGIGRVFGTSELMPIVARYDNHPITSEMNNVATLFPLARTVEAGSSKDAKASVSPLLETSQASFATDYTGEAQIKFDQKTARRGPLTLGVAGTMTAGPKPGSEGKFVVYGSPDFAVNTYLSFEGNRDLFMNSMNWLSAQEKFISIRPKPPESTPIHLSVAQMRWIESMVLFGLPGLIVLSGLGVWWRRRSA